MTLLAVLQRLIKEMTEFEKVYRKNQAKWLKVLQKIVTNQADAEDIMQDALCKALTDMDKYDPTRSSLNTWFTMIMFTEMRRWFKRNKKDEKTLPIGWYDEAIDYSFTLNGRCALSQGISHTPSLLDKKIIELRYVHGYKQEEVRLILGVSEGKISSTTTKFRQLLKD
jgi:DNA-directed RNA polymerase specialized sigma24 family protein